MTIWLHLHSKPTIMPISNVFCLTVSVSALPIACLASCNQETSRYLDIYLDIGNGSFIKPPTYLSFLRRSPLGHLGWVSSWVSGRGEFPLQQRAGAAVVQPAVLVSCSSATCCCYQTIKWRVGWPADSPHPAPHSPS